MIGPWTLGDNSHERYPHIWYRLDILNSAPMSAFRVIAEVWPRGASGYGWAVTLPDGRKIEGESRDAIAGDEENLRRCKAAADKTIAIHRLAEDFASADSQDPNVNVGNVGRGFAAVSIGDCDCEDCALERRSMEAREKQPVPSLHVIPDVRHMPIEDRREVFLDGLRALTQMTGVVIAAHDARDAEDEYTGDIALRDIDEAGTGQYHMNHDNWCSWWRSEDEPNRVAYERRLRANAVRMKLGEMRAVLAVREQHKVTRGVDGLRADIAAAEAELRTLEAT